MPDADSAPMLYPHSQGIAFAPMHFVLLQVVAIALLILANAFFVAAEFAMVSIRDTRVEQMIAASLPGAVAVRQIQQDIDDFLPAVQLGVTLCSLALGWIGEPVMAAFFLRAFQALPLLEAHMLPYDAGFSKALPHMLLYSHVAAVAVGFAMITYLHVLLGELVPKSLALRRADALAVAIAPPMLLFMTLVRPVVHFLRISAAFVLRAFNVPVTEKAAAHSPEELKLIATAARRVGVLPAFQEILIHRALELEEVSVREIMTPRQKIIALPSDMLIEEASAQVIHYQHSRVPVYDETRGPEHIIGVVYSKDLARLMHFRPTPETDPAENTLHLPGHLLTSSFVSLRLSQIMRDVLVVPETNSVLDIIREFQHRRRQMAIVVDEYGTIVGLVTAEDAIEQLTGEFEDEFDDPARPVVTTATGALILDGGVNLRDLETQMKWSLPRKGGIETLAGFFLYQLGRVPHPGETISYENRKLTVLEMDRRRIARIRVEPIEPDLLAVEEQQESP